MAGLRTRPATAKLPQENLPAKHAALALYALTPTPCASGLPAGIPKGFRPTQHKGVDVWEGEVGGLGLRILSVACARPQREGGWDMASHQARAVQSLLPAGSVLYVQLQDPDHFTPQALQQTLITLTHVDGRNLFVAGRLPSSSTFQG